MPQSSLMTWLNKPQPEQLPTPPRFSRDNPRPHEPEPEPEPEPEHEHESKPAPLFNPTSQQPLPANVELRACTKDDIASLRRLTSLLLPIPYPDKFYREIVADPLTNDITMLALWHDHPEAIGKQKGRLVGAIRCRLLAHPQGEPSVKNGDKPMLYLSTLALLSPYRTYGIASHMLQILTKRAVTNHGISSVGAHVWEANTDGLAWYRKRGFREIGREPDYYRRLDPQGAVIMRRDVGPMDLLAK